MQELHNSNSLPIIQNIAQELCYQQPAALTLSAKLKYKQAIAQAVLETFEIQSKASQS